MFENLLFPTISTVIPSLFLWVFLSLSIGLCFIIAVVETICYFIKDTEWKEIALRLQKYLRLSLYFSGIFLLLSAIPVALNWLPFWEKVPAFIPYSLLVSEGFLILLSVFLFRALLTKRSCTPAKKYALYSWILNIPLALTLWIPLAIEAWRECPLGTAVNQSDFSLCLTHVSWFLFSPLTVLKFFHAIISCWLAGAAFLIFILCAHAIKGTVVFFRKGMTVALPTAFLSLCFIICLGDRHGYLVSQQQPLKMASIQQLEKGGREIPFTIAGPLKVPSMLSRLATHHNRGFVPGIQDVLNGGYPLPEGGTALSVTQKQKLAEQACHADNTPTQEKLFRYSSQYIGYKNITDSRQLLPNSAILFWTFRFMIGLGFLIFIPIIALFYLLFNQDTPWKKRILRSGLGILPVVYICSFCGWLIAEYGIYPWAVTDFLSSPEAITSGSPWVFAIEAVIISVLSLGLFIRSLRLYQNVSHD